jgi:hypothetical protein
VWWTESRGGDIDPARHAIIERDSHGVEIDFG